MVDEYSHNVFGFLINHRHWDLPPIEIAARVREYIEDLHPSTATFKKMEMFDEDDPDYSNMTEVYNSCYKLVGAWPMPKEYDLDNVWVNPEYNHAWMYAQVSTTCPSCGNTFTLHEPADSQATVPHDADNYHEDSCPVEYHFEVKRDLHSQRRHIINDSLWFGHTGQRVSNRIGLKGTSFTSESRQHCIDKNERLERYRERRAFTAAYLYPETHVGTLSTVFEVSRNHLRKEINKRTPWKASELTKIEEHHELQ
jgi:hypothetical protein